MNRGAIMILGIALAGSMLGRYAAAQQGQPAQATQPVKLDQPPGLYAIFGTTKGRIVCRLFPDKTPETVANFVGLTNGTKKWYHYGKKTWVQRRYYDGLTFHRVIPDFMIQGGDYVGDGTGGVGYTFKDEFSPDLKFDIPGRLAMANSGPNTNGAQFFITTVPTPHLDNHHTIFGQVVEGQEVAETISQVPRDADDKPTTPVVMNSVRIVEVK